jgi:hypothetical protein
MKRKMKRLALSRETLRGLDGRLLGVAKGGVSRICGTAETGCAVCYTTDVTDCPGCVFSAACISVMCASGITCAC